MEVNKAKAKWNEMVRGSANARVGATYYNGQLIGHQPYNGASSTRQAMKAWKTREASADRDLIPSLSKLRARSRDAIRNIPIARSARGKQQLNVIGTGLKPKPRLDHELLGIEKSQARAIEKQIRKLFELWARDPNECDAARTSNFYQMTALAYGARLDDGDCFSTLPAIERVGGAFGLKVNLIEAERCRTPAGLDALTNNIRGGIEKDNLGAPVNYYFQKNNPSDLYSTSTIDEFVKVPAFGEKTGRRIVIHMYKKDRIGQSRGEPLLAPFLEPIKQLGRYQDAEIMAAVVSGMFTVFIKTLEGGPNSEGNIDLGEKVGSANDYEMSYGAILDLNKDEDVTFANPGRPNANYDPFVNSIFKEIGAGLNIPYEVLLGAFTSSYSASRAAILQAWKNFKVDRQDVASDFCQPIYETLIMESVDRGYIDLPGYTENPLFRKLYSVCDWMGDAPGSLDPEKEAKYYKMAVEEGFMSRTHAAQEFTNQDYESVLDEQAEEMEWRKERGLPEPGEVDQVEETEVTETESGEVDETKEMKTQLDAYGVGVRAGAHTPQIDDEEHFREMQGLPPMSEEAKRAWQEAGGVKYPITLLNEGEQETTSSEVPEEV